MNDEKMNLDDVIAKTMDALTATGLQYGSLQYYWKFLCKSRNSVTKSMEPVSMILK